MAGISLNGVAFCLREAANAALGNLPLVCLQEVPREDPGWHTVEVQDWSFVSHRDPAMWRGQAVGFKTGTIDRETGR